MINRLPEEVLTKIFTPLPVKTLVVSTAVCKYWFSLITNPTFITNHLKSTTADFIFVKTPEGKGETDVDHYSLYHHNNDNSQTLCKYSTLRFPKDYSWTYRVIDVIDGLVCLSRDAQGIIPEFMLWNPAIHKFVETPEARVRFKTHGAYDHTIGFGVDSRTHDYKIVRVVYLDDGDMVPAEVDVYSLSTGKWRDISAKVGLKNYVRGRTKQTYLNGVVHWAGHYWNSGNCRSGSVIMTFSMDDEVFGEIQLPDHMASKYGVSPLMVYQDKLAVVEEVKCQQYDFEFSVWVMREYGVRESWTKLFTFAINWNNVKILGFRNNGDLMLAPNKGNLFSYDPNARKLRDLGIPCRPVYTCRLYVAFSYRENLVLLWGKDSEAITSKKSIGEKNQGTEDKETEEKERAKKITAKSEEVNPISTEGIQGTEVQKDVQKSIEEDEGSSSVRAADLVEVPAADSVEVLYEKLQEVELLED